LARPRFAPTISFRHIRLIGALIYIKLRQLDFSSFFLPCSSSTMCCLTDLRCRCPPVPPLSTAPSAVSLPPLLCSCRRCTTAATALCHHRCLSSARAAATPQPPLLCTVATIHSCAIATIHSCAVAAVHSRAAVVLAAAAPSVVPSAGSSRRSIQHVVGHDKRKGKESVVEPTKKKKTRAQKEVERAAMAARAADD
jgi:hypothetical protein